jgi:hypothetical protein
VAFPKKQRRAEERAFWNRAAGKLFPSAEDRLAAGSPIASIDEAIDEAVALAGPRQRMRHAAQ